MNETVGDGTYRDHLEQAARLGSPFAREELEGQPEYPIQLEHFVEWTYELHGRSGAGFGGLLPLSHQELESWSRLRKIPLSPLEVQGLMLLDLAMLRAGKSSDED